LPIFVLNGRFGPYVQLGVKMPKVKKAKISDSVKPRMASIPKGVDLGSITIPEAMKFLSIPRTLGTHPKTGKTISASIGRFGPYVVHDGNYRSIKAPLSVYDITNDQALELLAQEKKPRGFSKKKKE